MKLVILSIVLLMVVISPVFAEKNLDIVVMTDKAVYDSGDFLTIDGFIIGYETSNHKDKAVTYTIKNPEKNLITTGSIIPDSDGIFHSDFIIGGQLWKTFGEYVIEVKFDGKKTKVQFDYTGGESYDEAMPEPEPEPEQSTNNIVSDESVFLEIDPTIQEMENSMLKKEINQLKAENKKLKNYNLILQFEIEDLQSIVNEQIRVIMTYFS